MHNTFQTRFGVSVSDNRKSKIKKRPRGLKWLGLLVLLFGWAGMAEAQQAEKVLRIGIVSWDFAIPSVPLTPYR